MKRFLLLVFSFILSTAIAVGADFPARPSPPRLVNDFQQVFSSSQRDALERKLVAYNDSTSTQIAIVTIGSLEGYDISDYSFQLAEKWGIGRKHKNNGILILAAMDDREVFIATGYGMEDVIPDAIAKRIVENTIIPNFKQQNFYGGFDEATDIIIGLASGKFTADKIEQKGINIPNIVFIIAIIIIILIISSRRKDGYMYTGRGWGSTPGPFVGGGFGGFGGRGGGGGGFGGFGGGSFGGGGAGGRW